MNADTCRVTVVVSPRVCRAANIATELPQLISSSLGTSPQSLPRLPYYTTPAWSTCNLGENIFASNYSKILCAVHAREVPHNTTWSHISLSIKSTQQNAGAGVEF